MTEPDKNDKMFAEYRKQQAFKRELRQDNIDFQRYKQTLGDDFPYKTVQGYRRAKKYYNEKYPNTPNKTLDFKTRIKLKSNAYPKELKRAKQQTHYKDSKDYKPTKSILTVNMDEIQEIINKYAGSGKIEFDKNGSFKNKELIVCDKDIGYCYSIKDNKFYKTNKFYIHYSKKGTHIVPTIKE